MYVEPVAAQTDQSNPASVTLDHKKTPGHVGKKQKVQKICASDYISKAKAPKKKTANKMFKAYKIPKSERQNYVVDRLVPVAIGGDNNKKNLWPISKSDQAAIDAKGASEQEARQLVCSNQLDLKTAQSYFKNDLTTAESTLSTVATASAVTTTTSAPITTTTTTVATTTTTTTTVRPPATTTPRTSSTEGTRHYTNSDGNEIESPDANTSGATAKCNDGSYSHSQHRQGTCSGHGGVQQWL